ncbi:cystathionine beta-lyase [Streptococcus sp. E17BB]|uniref:cystathionine beta-lyase n=1 Tax=Streptococcus sp. E17BB TaxID=3278714 RepID=UPI00359D6499
MTNEIDLALTYGGYTSLDRVYLTRQLQGLSRVEQLKIITPPPSVVNAYFAEHYQKTSPKAACDYLLELSTALDLFESYPSFAAEDKPFVRLNLSGRAFGFAFVNAQGLATVFAEDEGEVVDLTLLELAELFPHLVVYREGDRVYLDTLLWEEEGAEPLTCDGAFLTTGHRLTDGTIKLSSYNRQELLDVASQLSGKQVFGYTQRQSLIYVLES